MSDWNPEKYLLFQKQRTQPAIDLANRVRDCAPRTIVDIGCGPGNSTAVLREVFPQAEILGIDNSPSMIERAKAKHGTAISIFPCAAQRIWTASMTCCFPTRACNGFQIMRCCSRD